LTGDQHTDHIATGQQPRRHSLPILQCFTFFANVQNILKFSLNTSGTFAFAPSAQANPKAKAKEPLFSTLLQRRFLYLITTFTN